MDRSRLRLGNQPPRGLDYQLQPPEAAIPPEEDAISIDAAMAMRATFTNDSRAVFALFVAVVDMLTGGGRKQLLKGDRAARRRDAYSSDRLHAPWLCSAQQRLRPPWRASQEA